ncbi:MAG TPA: NfeD family protein [Pirellulaceae bacterium]|nr:NfeD family protein [Pirellulaceae bacterium]
MQFVFILCAVVGGTILVCQFVLTLIGLGGDSFDLVDDLPDAGDMGDVGDIGDLASSEHHGSTFMFGILSFKTLVAATTFFGLTGMAASTSGLGLPMQLLIAVVCGGSALVIVHWLMRTLFQLGQSGTLQISNTLGKTATVYIPIPGDNAGTGKVQVKVQDRLAEFAATTSAGDKLITGAKVVVVDVIDGSTLKVEPLSEPAEANA